MGFSTKLPFEQYRKYLPPLRLHQLYFTLFPSILTASHRMTQMHWKFTQFFVEFLYFLREINPYSWMHNNGDAIDCDFFKLSSLEQVLRN